MGKRDGVPNDGGGKGMSTDYDAPYSCACCGKKTTNYLCGRCARKPDEDENVAPKADIVRSTGAHEESTRRVIALEDSNAALRTDVSRLRGMVAYAIDAPTLDSCRSILTDTLDGVNGAENYKEVKGEREVLRAEVVALNEWIKEMIGEFYGPDTKPLVEKIGEICRERDDAREENERLKDTRFELAKEVTRLQEALLDSKYGPAKEAR
jgi:hypothetical protein